MDDKRRSAAIFIGSVVAMMVGGMFYLIFYLAASFALEEAGHPNDLLAIAITILTVPVLFLAISIGLRGARREDED